jgi:hypothetical protein
VDKGTKEEVVQGHKTGAKRAHGFDSRGFVLCKGCKTIHVLDSLLATGQVRFPEGNLSVIEARCPNLDEQWFRYDNTYEHAEVLFPMGSSAHERVEPQGFMWDAEIICKECKRVHPFTGYGTVIERAHLFRFPDSDFSTVTIPCLYDLHTSHDYNYKEVLTPRIHDNAATLEKLEERVNALEGRFQIATGTFAQELDKAKTELRDAVTGLIEEEKKKNRQKGTPTI